MIYLELFIGFLQVGLFSFGGAYGAIPLIRDIVLRYGWLSEDALTNMIAVSESTPGPIMLNLATYVGSSKAGLPGAVVATVAVVLPSFVIILLIMIAMRNLLKKTVVQEGLRGLKPCIVGIILATGVYMTVGNCFTKGNALTVSIPDLLLTVVLACFYFGSKKYTKKGSSPVLLIVISAFTGMVLFGTL